MQKNEIKTSHAPAAIGPYSQGIQVGELIFVSGQIAVDPATGEMVTGDIDEQTHQVFRNLQAILAQAGSNLLEVVKVTIFLKNLADFGAVNAIYSTYFHQPYPARACVEVAGLPKDALIEMELLAVKDHG